MQTHLNGLSDTRRVVRVVIEKRGRCVVNSPLGEPCTVAELMRAVGRFCLYEMDSFGVLILVIS